MENLFNLNGLVALVAGGYGGIGTALSWGLARYGASVAVAGRSPERARACAAALAERGYRGYGTAFDVLEVEEIARMVDEVHHHFGRIDILVNCVGTHIEAPAEELAEAAWDKVVDTNLKGAFFLSQAVARHQIAARTGGRHIHLTSVRSALGIRRGYIAYCSSKGGLPTMIRQLATEWARYNITVNAIAPTFIRTDLVKEYLDDEAFYTTLVNRIPLARVGDPIDLVGATLLFASPAGAFITGQNLFVDGGVTATQ